MAEKQELSLGTVTDTVAYGKNVSLYRQSHFSLLVPSTQQDYIISTVKFTAELLCCCIYHKTERLDKEVIE